MIPMKSSLSFRDPATTMAPLTYAASVTQTRGAVRRTKAKSG
jgi:hypothetical protein